MTASTNGTNGHANGHVSLDFTSFSNIIDGKFVSSTKKSRNINPSTLEENPEVPIATQKDVDDTVSATIKAGERWAEVPIAERQEAVVKFADALASLKEQFATMLTKEQGKPLVFAKQEVDNAVNWLKGQAKIPFPEEIIEESDERIVVT
jgi:acyl-CoA reductase-like NAD-dependent aldehyde dehydrogenase